MKKNEIKIGGQYTCKVSDKIVVVKITGENPHGGWDAINLKTNKNVRIKSAQRLRTAKFIDEKALAEKLENRSKSGKGKAKAADSRRGLLPHEQVTIHPVDQPAEPPATPPAEAEDVAPVDTGDDAEPTSAKDTTAPAGRDTGEPGATGGKKLGLVSAAILVLEDAGADAAMNCHELVKQATERGLWQPRAGKTPANTLYAAILREINDKGEASRFRKTDRGKFALNKVN